MNNNKVGVGGENECKCVHAHCINYNLETAGHLQMHYNANKDALFLLQVSKQLQTMALYTYLTSSRATSHLKNLGCLQQYYTPSNCFTTKSGYLYK